MSGTTDRGADRLDRRRVFVARTRPAASGHSRELGERHRPFSRSCRTLVAPGIFDRAEDEATRVASVLTSNSRFDGRVAVGAPVAGARNAHAAPAVRLGLSSSGRPLDVPTRAFYESRFGRDLSDVRVHVGPSAAASARALSARAFTVGRDVVMGEGEFRPQTADGRRLLAHELTHVVQQANARGALPDGTVQRQASPELERIRDYLSYGLFDLKIRDYEAIAALELLKTLPRFQQAEFVSDEKYLERLRSNLPSQRAAELDEIVKGVSSMVPPRSDLETIIENLSYGVFDLAITDREAIEALDVLKRLPPDQLAVALSRIDYGRLMDNLPEERRKELIDLLAKGLGTGGTREVSERTEPGVALRSLTFRSDHGVMRDNTSDWTSSGAPYPEPEWKVVSPEESVSAPISHTKDRNVDIELGFDVVPAAATPAPVAIEGRSDVDFLRFSSTGTQSGGSGKRVPMTSAGKLPDAVTVFRDKYVTWRMRWGAWDHEVGRTGPFTIFVTMDDPRSPGEVTTRRMAKAVELVSSSPLLDPHTIVKTMMFKWTTFNLDVTYSNPWDLADDMATGAECIALVRFVDAVIAVAGVPGATTAVVVWAKPTSPLVAEERIWPHAGMSSAEVAGFPGEPTWQAALLDGTLRPNNFEAALKFTHGAVMRYYPGGVPIVVTTPNEVLRVFTCLAWIVGVGGGEYEVKNVPAVYRPPGPAVGARHRW